MRRVGSECSWTFVNPCFGGLHTVLHFVPVGTTPWITQHDPSPPKLWQAM